VRFLRLAGREDQGDESGKDLGEEGGAMKSGFYIVNSDTIEVSLGLQFKENEDDFEDVTFLVRGSEDKKEAIRRVEKFVKMLADEFRKEESKKA
jgi:hypothetical protein